MLAECIITVIIIAILLTSVIIWFTRRKNNKRIAMRGGECAITNEVLNNFIEAYVTATDQENFMEANGIVNEFTLLLNACDERLFKLVDLTMFCLSHSSIENVKPILIFALNRLMKDPGFVIDCIQSDSIPLDETFNIETYETCVDTCNEVIHQITQYIICRGLHNNSYPVFMSACVSNQALIGIFISSLMDICDMLCTDESFRIGMMPNYIATMQQLSENIFQETPTIKKLSAVLEMLNYGMRVLDIPPKNFSDVANPISGHIFELIVSNPDNKENINAISVICELNELTSNALNAQLHELLGNYISVLPTEQAVVYDMISTITDGLARALEPIE